MDLGPAERDVIYLWGKITTLSPIEKIEKGKGKEMVVYYLKTLTMMSLVLDDTDWLVMHITREDAINLLQGFHATYINTIMG